ncbi:uncharacterized protein BDCG_17313 [Blastomyces dermatitidis ER-3]|uniref:Uncharacterized protein n=2 Tax=Ajellomyces dermatitidis TaxID=5039 RepID=A0A0J9EQ89_AJEDA|nr:uncharacterized protein BDCG_17313 [Blastomyces dermatitidis ER-3]KMW68181.1 hypothetical protein BDDG_12626 [Blastomyces dermatitidis ATCC 18188]OAT01960.1 hypothetical protein BDCG_17313 [Blastomyces dermatitidis ER-3]
MTLLQAGFMTESDRGTDERLRSMTDERRDTDTELRSTRDGIKGITKSFTDSTVQSSLCEKMIDEYIRSELEQYMSPELMIMIDAVLMLSSTTSAVELQQWIRAIHAISAYCSVEEGPICHRRGCGSSPKPTTPKLIAHKAEAIGQPSSDRLLESAA